MVNFFRGLKWIRKGNWVAELVNKYNDGYLAGWQDALNEMKNCILAEKNTKELKWEAMTNGETD